jgi:hypothetical protein
VIDKKFEHSIHTFKCMMAIKPAEEKDRRYCLCDVDHSPGFHTSNLVSTGKTQNVTSDETNLYIEKTGWHLEQTRCNADQCHAVVCNCRAAICGLRDDI